ncbi:hypothetical protein ACFQE1_21585, partial [Halobium palmae]
MGTEGGAASDSETESEQDAGGDSEGPEVDALRFTDIKGVGEKTAESLAALDDAEGALRTG